jgi:hypothetical protein
MATTPKPRASNSKTANRRRSATASRTASNARQRPAAAKTLPTPEPSTASKLRGPLLAGGAAVAGIAGGIALGAKARSRRRHTLPSLPSMNGLDLKKVDMKKARKQVGRASKQFGAFTRELRKAGEQAERIGNALD